MRLTNQCAVAGFINVRKKFFPTVLMGLTGVGVLTRIFSLLFTASLAFSAFKHGSYKSFIVFYLCKNVATIICDCSVWIMAAVRPNHAVYSYATRKGQVMEEVMLAADIVFDICMLLYTSYIAILLLVEAVRRKRVAARLFDDAITKGRHSTIAVNYINIQVL
jgi:hypothetical protein